MKNYLYQILSFSLLLFAVVWLSYFTDRTEHFQLISFYLLGWIAAIFLVFTNGSNSKPKVYYASLLIKLLVVFSLPALSDDFYRFIWDGNLIVKGQNPFLFTPNEWTSNNNLSSFESELYQQLNSKNYFAVYPPLNQLFFAFSRTLGGESILMNLLAMRFLFFIAEFILFYTISYFKKLNNLILLCFINPFWIIESFVNLHFELLVVSFLGLGWIIERKYLVLKAILLGLAAATKLPALLWVAFLGLPKKLNDTLKIGFYFLFGFSIWWWLFPSWFGYKNMLTSVHLFVNSFEFNASIFYIIRKLGFIIYSYDVIKTAGPILFVVIGVTSFSFVLLALKRPKNVLNYALYACTIYLLLSTTVHPWYVIPILFFGAFSGYLFPFVWAITSWLSYLSYTQNGVNELTIILWLEYLPVLLLMGFEIVFGRERVRLFFIKIYHQVVVPIVSKSQYKPTKY